MWDADGHGGADVNLVGGTRGIDDQASAFQLNSTQQLVPGSRRLGLSPPSVSSQIPHHLRIARA